MEIIKSINDHIKLQEMCLKLTNKILDSSIREDFDLLVSLTENRERLLLTLTHIFQDIDHNLNLLSAEHITPDLIVFIKEWQSKMIKLSENITKIDEEVLLKLEESKDSLAIEISKIYKQKENLRGYDLSNVKR